MSKTIKCDCCGRTSPEVNCKYQRRKVFQFFEDNDGYYLEDLRRLDICQECWNYLQSIIQNKIMAKPAMTFEKPSKCAKLESLQFDNVKDKPTTSRPEPPKGQGLKYGLG